MELVTNQNRKQDYAYVKKAEQNQAYKIIGQLRVRKGLTLWYYCYDDGTLNKAKITEEVDIDVVTKEKKIKKRTHFVDNSVYFFALNERTAKRKVNKLLKLTNK